MTATQEIREKAALFGWRGHADQGRHAVLIRADQMVDVAFTAGGSVLSATLYRFFSVNDLEERARTADTHKKETVLAWLAN